MRSALYYPHTEVSNKNLIKCALLLFDQLEYIAPFKQFRPDYADKKIAEAMELIGRSRVPTMNEKKNSHKKIEDFATKGLPDAFFYKESGWNEYEIWPQKLMPETFDMLRDLGMSGHQLANSDYPVTELTGLAVMSILADCCAGETRARVTDRGLAYASITNLMTDKSDECCYGDDIVVPITLRTIDTKNIPLDALIEFRKREEMPGGNEIKKLRHRYNDRIQSHIKALKSAKSRSDFIEIDRQFIDEMDDDLKILRSELRGCNIEAVLSKEVVATAVLSVSTVAAFASFGNLDPLLSTSLSGSLISLGGVLATKYKYTKSKKEIMKKHPMAYIYNINEHYAR